MTFRWLRGLSMAALMAASSEARAAGETSVQFGLSGPATGNPRNLCVFDQSHTCVPLGTLDSTSHTFTAYGFAGGAGPAVDYTGAIYAAAYGVKCDGVTNNDAALAAISTAVGSGGRKIVFPAGVCKYNYWALSSKNGVTIEGQGGLDLSGQATILLCTAIGPAICNAFNNNNGFNARDIAFNYATSAFTGVLVDLSCSASLWNNDVWQRVSFSSGGNANSAGTLIYLKNVVNFTLDGFRLSNGVNGIVGSYTGDSDSSYEGGVSIRLLNGVFAYVGSTIVNPRLNWTIKSVNFEGGPPDGSGKSPPAPIIVGAGKLAQGLYVDNSSFTDNTTGGAWIAISGTLRSFTLHGGTINAGDSSDPVNGIVFYAGSVISGMSIKGVEFGFLSNAVYFNGSSCAGVSINGNTFTGMSSPYINFGSNGCDADSDFGGNYPNVVQPASYWTPTLTFGGGSTGMTYSVRSGTYRRKGGLISAQFRLTLSAKGSSSGAAAITGWPGGGASSQTPISCGYYSGFASVAGISGYLFGASASLTIPGASSVGAVSDANMTNSSDMICSITYPAVN